MDKLFTVRLGKAGSFYIVLEAFYDKVTTPADDEGMSEAEVKNYDQGYWSYVDVKVSVRLFGTDLGNAWLGGMQYGSGEGWQISETDLANEVLTDHSWLIDEAIAEGQRQWDLMREAEFGEFVTDVAVGRYANGDLVK
jgi:hypothetical protein